MAVEEDINVPSFGRMVGLAKRLWRLRERRSVWRGAEVLVSGNQLSSKVRIAWNYPDFLTNARQA
jgi:hypothetical protein